MGLNIKNPETERLVRKLAALTGEGQTEAITVAVRSRLKQLQAKSGSDRMRRLEEIANKMASRFKPPFDAIDHGELLFDDETGLPK